MAAALGGECVHGPERTGQPERATDDLGAGGQVAVLGHRGGQPADEDHQGGAARSRQGGGAMTNLSAAPAMSDTTPVMAPR